MTMRLVVVAATGGIGRHLVDQALAQGHEVTAVVRSPHKVQAGVRAVAADLADPDHAALCEAVEGADAVLSGLGPRSIKDAGITAPGTAALIKAMEAAGTRRLVVVSAAPVSTVPSPARPRPPRHDPGEGFFTRHVLTPLIKRVLRVHYADLALMEDALHASALDWTIVRPPRLTDGPMTGTYRTAYGQNVQRGLVVSRADVAHLMLDTLTSPRTVKQALGVAR